MSSKNEMKESRRQLTRLGFTATKTRGGHWRFEHPDMDGPVFAPDTPSDRRGIKALHAFHRWRTRSPGPVYLDVQ
jgi:predicted RNA binding protein YcfA (HicA-like mRNA interferase family)